MPPPPAGEYLTPADVARKLKVAAETVRSLCRQGKLKAVRVGQQYRILAADLAAYLDQQCIGKEVPASAPDGERDGSPPAAVRRTAPRSRSTSSA